METINGCTVIRSSEAPEPVHFGAAESHGAYVVIVGTFPAGQPAPPLHVHPHTDEAFYVADGDATFRLGDRELPVTAGGLVFVPRGMPHTVWNSGDRPVVASSSYRPGTLSTSSFPSRRAEATGIATGAASHDSNPTAAFAP